MWRKVSWLKETLSGTVLVDLSSKRIAVRENVVEKYSCRDISTLRINISDNLRGTSSSLSTNAQNLATTKFYHMRYSSSSCQDCTPRTLVTSHPYYSMQSFSCSIFIVMFVSSRLVGSFISFIFT